MTVITFNQEKKQEVQHKIGNWYKREYDKELYILASVDYDKVNLICVQSGCRWLSTPLLVTDETTISQE